MKRSLNPLVLVMLAAVLGGCGDEPSPIEPALVVPDWANVAPEQIAEAKKHGVPVAFENHLGMRFVLIPAGTFLMGSRHHEDTYEADRPQHEVTITRPFYMQIHEVRNADFWRFEPSHATEPRIPARAPGKPDEPVTWVSWTEAQAFATWLGLEDEQRSYRLPREAEWEYACRTGRTTAYSWGDDVAGGERFANAMDPVTQDVRGISWAGWAKDDAHRREAPVGSYLPSAWGLYDMHGNVWEWCLDWFGSYDARPVKDPTGPVQGLDRVKRGGSHYDGVNHLRAWFRVGHEPQRRNVISGFRLISPLPEKAE